MGIMFLPNPPDPIDPGDRCRVNERGTVNHIVRTTGDLKGEPGRLVMAYCGEVGRLPDLYRDSRTVRPPSSRKRLCKNCAWREPR